MSTSANDTQRMSALPEDALHEIEQVHSRWTEVEAAGEKFTKPKERDKGLVRLMIAKLAQATS
jgi:hypothetical protein